MRNPNIITDEPRSEMAQDSFEEYAAFPALNSTALKLFDEARGGAPAKAAYYINTANDPDDDRDTEALRFGNLYHRYILQMDEFDVSVKILDDGTKQELLEKAIAAGSKATKFSKNLKPYQEFKKAKASAGIELIDEFTASKLAAMQGALVREPDIREALGQPGRSEVSLYFGLPYGERFIQCKARIDHLPDNPPDILDLKTCRRANAEEFARSIPRLGYDLQAAFYKLAVNSLGGEHDNFRFICQEKEPPYLAAIYDMPPDWMAYAEHELNAILSRVKTCLERDDWGGYISGQIMPPAYMEEIIEQIA